MTCSDVDSLSENRIWNKNLEENHEKHKEISPDGNPKDICWWPQRIYIKQGYSPSLEAHNNTFYGHLGIELNLWLKASQKHIYGLPPHPEVTCD